MSGSLWCWGERSTARQVGIAPGGPDQLVDHARLGHGVAGVGDDAQLGLRPGAPQIPGILYGGNHVIAAVHDRARQMPNNADIEKKLIVPREKSAIDEVVALDAGESNGVIVGAK